MAEPKKHGFYWYRGDETRVDGVAYWQPVRVDPMGRQDIKFTVWVFAWDGPLHMDDMYGEWGDEIRHEDPPWM